jgi:two-component system phosphate regulon response regulator PhoB
MAQVSHRHADPPVPDSVAALEIPEVTPRRGAILVIEDRTDVRQGLTQLLELHGFLVLDAPDGERAVEQLTNEPDGIALVMLDLMLPGRISGHDVRSRQLADEHTATIPTIVVSACEPDLRGRAQLRPDAWLEKPFRFDELLEIVKRFVVPEPGGVLGIEQ